MKVNRLFKKVNINSVLNNHQVFSIVDNSNNCIENSIYVPIVGSKHNGYDYLDEAINNGTKTIIYDRHINKKKGINYVKSHNNKKILADLLYYYNLHKMKRIKFIGVVGTNGKTTTSSLIYNFLQYMGRKSMLIGSNGVLCSGVARDLSNTTPGISILYELIDYAYRNDIEFIVMEASSIGILEHRIDKIPFKYLIFTNFSEDHLDYHKSMDNYLNAKALLFDKLNSNSYAIINKDDNAYKRIIEHCDAKILDYSINDRSMYEAYSIKSSAKGIKFRVNHVEYKTNLIGSFNVYNILPLIALSEKLGYSYNDLTHFLNGFSSVNGRMNLINVKNKRVIIDYAHTPDAIKLVIEEAKRICDGTVYVITGCGGNREHEKRPIIGNILSQEGIISIVTTDNPRYEDPNDIINDILKGAIRELLAIENREDAIYYALNNMSNNDLLLILGKGCEKIISIRGHKIKYSDYEVIRKYKEE